MATAASAYPVRFEVEYPERLSRWLIFIKWLLVFPHLLILEGFGCLVVLTTFISWFAIMFTKRYPRGLWDMAMVYMRWRANVVTYTALLRDEYPPFGEGSYPVTFAMEYPEQSNRWTVGLRLILVVPHLVVLIFVLLVWLAAAIIAWFAILFTGRYPRGLFEFGVGAMRWSLRVTAYMFLMRDEYPPFSLS